MNKNLTIRQATERDVNNILFFELKNRVEFSKYIPLWSLEYYTVAHLKRLLTGAEKSLQYLVFLKNGILIGRFSGHIIDYNNHTLEISYCIDKKHSNKGVAGYVLRRILLIWACHGIGEIYANVASHNAASMKVLESCGFIQCDIEHNAMNLDFAVYDYFVYKWIATEG